MLKIGDLGLAKHLLGTVGRTFGGTREYMSPEQRAWDLVSENDYDYGNLPETYSFKTDVWLDSFYAFLPNHSWVFHFIKSYRMYFTLKNFTQNICRQAIKYLGLNLWLPK